MLGAGGRRPGDGWSGGRRAGMMLGLCATALSIAVSVTSCASTVPGSGVAAPGEVAAYRSEVTAARQAAIREAGADLCRQSMSSMVVMVRGYNAFVARLNELHSYASIGDLDDKARASLIAGGDQIRPKIVEKAPADVTAPAQAFLDSTVALESAIGKRRLVGLNPAATRWTTDKQRLLDACATYVPAPPVMSAPVPAPR